LKPLYNTVPRIVEKLSDLYQLLLIVETLRVGTNREKEIAIKELDKYLFE